MLAGAYTTYLLAAFDRLHDIYPAPGYVFSKPFVELPRLFDGNHTGSEVLGVPAVTRWFTKLAAR